MYGRICQAFSLSVHSHSYWCMIWIVSSRDNKKIILTKNQEAVLFRWLSYLHVLCLDQSKNQQMARVIIIIILSGVRLSPFGNVATTGLLYQPRMIDDGDCGMKIGRENWRNQRKRAPVPLCPPQIPHEQTGARTQATTVGSQLLTAWAMAQPWQGW
jgi:hypothetical protein